MVHATDTEQLLLVLYDELRLLASSWLAKEHLGQTLQPTALVHEVYIRLHKDSKKNGYRWENKAHFFASAARAMRRILVENARRKGRLRHGGKLQRAIIDSVDLDIPADQLDLLDLDEALNEFENQYPIKSKVVQLRFFAGLSHNEIAQLLDVSVITVKRYWRFSRAWLYRRLNA